MKKIHVFAIILVSCTFCAAASNQPTKYASPLDVTRGVKVVPPAGVKMPPPPPNSGVVYEVQKPPMDKPVAVSAQVKKGFFARIFASIAAFFKSLMFWK